MHYRIADYENDENDDQVPHTLSHLSAFPLFCREIFRKRVLRGSQWIAGDVVAARDDAILSWTVRKVTKDDKQYEWMRFISLLAMCIIAGILSNKYDMTIRRFSNTFTAMLLIYIGKVMYQRMRLSFDNGYMAIACALVAFEVASMLGGVSLNGNEYNDILQLIVAAPAVLYIIMYIGKHIENKACENY